MEQIERIIEDLSRLSTAPGVAGQTAIAALAADMRADYTDEVTTDAMGNVLRIRRCGLPDAPTVLLEAHMDEIGFLVTHIDEQGFVHVAGAGGTDARVLAAQEVDIYGEDVYRGVFCTTVPHLKKKDDTLPQLSERGIDVGMDRQTAMQRIPLGSRVTFVPRFCRMNEQVVSAKALDNRAGMAAVLHCLRTLPDTLAVDVAVAFCVQEEVGCRGACPAVRRLCPDVAIVTDVSFALTPDANPLACGEMGKGVMIGLSPLLDAARTDALIALAKEKNIPYQYEVMGGGTGTDADQISGCHYGIPTMLLSIPLRYMHTPIETLDVRDVAAVGALMAAYIAKGEGAA